MSVAMGQLDGLVFTGGAGQASPRLRADVCSGLGLLGIAAPEQDAPPVERPSSPDDGAGAATWAQRDPARRAGRVVSAAGVRPAVVVVEAREDLEILREVVRLCGRW